MIKKSIAFILGVSAALLMISCGEDKNNMDDTINNETTAGAVLTEPASETAAGEFIPEKTAPQAVPLSGMKMLYGNITEKDGKYTTPAFGGYSTAVFDGVYGDFVAEADFIGHMYGGGFIFRCDPDKVSKASSDSFYGYHAFIGREGTVGALGFAMDKWIGNLSVTPNDVFKRGSDLHLRLVAVGDRFVFTVTNIETGKTEYICTYNEGDAENDTCRNRKGLLGLRIYNNGGKGYFTNVTVTELPEACDTGLKIGGGESLEISFSYAKDPAVITLDRITFLADSQSETLSVLRGSGNPKWIANARIHMKNDTVWLFERVGDGLRFSADGSFLFEFPFSGDGSLGSSVALSSSAGKAPEVPTGSVYTNPVVAGADPEVYYENGTYYLYTWGNKSITVRTSKDLVNWNGGKVCCTPIGSGGITSFMSPNVFMQDGIYYMFFAAKANGKDFRLFYATSDSPDGTFTVKDDSSYLEDITEIGGAPFRDDDGKLYLTTVRFGGGNHIWIMEIEAKNGRVRPVGDARLCIDPTEDYEIDSYGKISEGGVITKHDGKYYMLYASGHYKGHYGESLAISDSVFGPYEKYEYNEVLTGNYYSDGIGDCVFINSPSGELYVMYHKHTVTGNRGSARSICLDRVVFEKDPAGGCDILRVVGPTVFPRNIPD